MCLSLRNSFLTGILENADKMCLFATIRDAAFTFQKMLWSLQLESPFLKGSGLSFRNFHKSRGGSDFYHKKGRGLWNKGEVILKKEVSLIFILTNPFQWYLSERLVCVCVLCIYTISISTVFVSREDLTLIESNQQIYDFCRRVIYKAKGIVEIKFLISANYSLSVIYIAVVST